MSADSTNSGNEDSADAVPTTDQTSENASSEPSSEDTSSGRKLEGNAKVLLLSKRMRKSRKQVPVRMKQQRTMTPKGHLPLKSRSLGFPRLPREPPKMRRYQGRDRSTRRCRTMVVKVGMRKREIPSSCRNIPCDGHFWVADWGRSDLLDNNLPLFWA